MIEGATSFPRWAEPAGESRASRAVHAELLARWSEPHRRYHTRDHLAAVLAAIDLLPGEAGDEAAVRLAAWFHDAVYDGRPGWDEERSAQLAQSRLPRCGVPARRVSEVARLVRLTAAHDTLAPRRPRRRRALRRRPRGAGRPRLRRLRPRRPPGVRPRARRPVRRRAERGAAPAARHARPVPHATRAGAVGGARAGQHDRRASGACGGADRPRSAAVAARAS
ncbi:hypothetical protein [Nonomuraea salmonea]|uniref:HD domain-containing protein n=1 Tax=Nonomuraea salmonea TaxID=46181 RepID=UPI0031E69F2B